MVDDSDTSDIVDTPGERTPEPLSIGRHAGYWPSNSSNRWSTEHLVEVIEGHDKWLLEVGMDGPEEDDLEASLDKITALGLDAFQPITKAALDALISGMDAYYGLQTTFKYRVRRLLRPDIPQHTLTLLLEIMPAKVVVFSGLGDGAKLAAGQLVTDKLGNSTDPDKPHYLPSFARVIIPVEGTRGAVAWISSPDTPFDIPIDWSPGSIIVLMGKASLQVDGLGTLIALCLDFVGVSPH